MGWFLLPLFINSIRFRFLWINYIQTHFSSLIGDIAVSHAFIILSRRQYALISLFILWFKGSSKLSWKFKGKRWSYPRSCNRSDTVLVSNTRTFFRSKETKLSTSYPWNPYFTKGYLKVLKKKEKKKKNVLALSGVVEIFFNKQPKNPPIDALCPIIPIMLASFVLLPMLEQR